MNRKHHKTETVIAACIFAGLSVLANMEEWTLADGTSFDAEFVMEMSGYATFRSIEGEEVKIEMDQLSPAARTQIDLKNPPRLEFDLVKDQNKVSFAAGLRTSGIRPPEYRVRYGARVYQRSSGTYDYPLDLEVFVIGQERLGEKYILLDRFDITFRLNKENTRKFEYKNDRIVVLRDYYVSDQPRGEDYYGYLAIVKDMRGEVVAAFSSPNWLQEHIGNLRKRDVGHSMDKTCARTHPTRPINYSH